MSHIKGLPSWKQGMSPTPTVPTLIGIAIGCAVAIVCAFTPPREFSYSFLSILLLSLAPFGGLNGYILWLSRDPTRWDLLRRITRFVSFPTIVVLLIAFPWFWRMGFFRNPLLAVMLVGFACSMVMYAASAGLGIIQLVSHLASRFRQAGRPGADPLTDGVSDRDLDLGGPPASHDG